MSFLNLELALFSVMARSALWLTRHLSASKKIHQKLCETCKLVARLSCVRANLVIIHLELQLKIQPNDPLLSSNFPKKNPKIMLEQKMMTLTHCG